MRVKLDFIKVRKILISVFILAGVFSGGYFLGVNGYRVEISKALNISINRATPIDKNVDMTLFWQTWDLLAEKYYDKTKLIPSQMIYGAIQGMVSSVGDPYTAFLSPSQNKVVNENLNGSFGGVGIEIGYRDGQLAVIAPLSDTPAAKAGIMPGDYIVKITDKNKNVDIDSTTISSNEAVTYIRGAEGTKVTLTLLRDGASEPIVVELTREKINIHSVTLSWVGEGSDIARIQVSEFGAETKSEWNKAVSEIMTKNTKGIIIDLRNNPGGYMQSAVELAGDFVPNGSVVVVQENGDGSKEEYKSESLPRLSKYKTVVLINKGSASASEILSGALRDTLGIKLVGDKSFGKGTIQEPIDMTGGSGIHVTTAKWLTPKGTWVHKEGIIPDIEVSNPTDGSNDDQLIEAIKFFN